MWELDCEESQWAPKNWCFWTVVLEKTLESPLDCKEIQPVHRKGDQSWVFIGRTDAEAETPILWPPHVKSRLIGKDPDAGRDWGQEEKGTRGWDVWMASPTRWTWVSVNSGSWWQTGRSGVLRFMGSQRVGHDWATELNWTESLSHVWLSYDPMDSSPPGFSVHEISQARILEQIAISFSRGSSQPRDRTHICCTAGSFITLESPAAWIRWDSYRIVSKSQANAG